MERIQHKHNQTTTTTNNKHEPKQNNDKRRRIQHKNTPTQNIPKNQKRKQKNKKMRITYEQLDHLVDNTPKPLLPFALQIVFSYECNIDTFSYYMFNHMITSKTPDFHYEIYDFLLEKRNGAMAAPRGFAKAQSLNSKVLTPNGWTTIKKLKIGDKIFTATGKLTTIIHLHPITEMNLYEIKTRDGRKTLCNKEHIWSVYIPQNTKHNKLVNRTTEELTNIYNKKRVDKRTNKVFYENKVYIPTPNPIQFKEKELPIDPYMLGAWLGDGTSSCGGFTTDDPEMIAYFPYTCKKQSYNKYGWTIHGLFRDLRLNNLLNNKHIPEIYLKSSIKQRTKLLQGLIDTDGTIVKGGKNFSFSNKNELLIDQVIELIRSLGGTCTKSKRITHCNNKPFESFIITCRIQNIIPCRLKRKKDLWIGSIKTKSAITNIEFKKKGLGRCITVEDPSGLYITDDYLVTHNSSIVGLFFLTWCIVNKRKKYIVYMSQNHEKTIQFIDPIRNEFKHNDRLRFVYGDLSPKSIDDESDRQGLIDINGVKVQAVSFNKNIRGFKDKFGNRPDLIIGDDIDDDERVINPDLRKRDRDKLTKQVIPSLANSDDAQFKMIGTIIHWDCLLMNRIRKYDGTIYKACTIVNGVINPKSLLWASFWSVERLQRMKHDIGSVAFNSEYLNNPLESEAALIKREWITACLDESLSYREASKEKYLQRYDGCDFAFGDRVTNDKSAYVALGVGNGPHTIFNIATYKGKSITQQFNLLQQRHKKFRFTETVMEENSIKGMSKELYNYKLNYYLIWTGNSDTITKIKKDTEFEGKRHTVSKKNMILRLATTIENGNVRIPYKNEKDKETSNQLIEELLTFALNNGKLVEVGVHADIPIALAMALERIGNSDEDAIAWV